MGVCVYKEGERRRMGRIKGKRERRDDWGRGRRKMMKGGINVER